MVSFTHPLKGLCTHKDALSSNFTKVHMKINVIVKHVSCWVMIIVLKRSHLVHFILAQKCLVNKFK